jgi:hypothetical protein
MRRILVTLGVTALLVAPWVSANQPTQGEVTLARCIEGKSFQSPLPSAPLNNGAAMSERSAMTDQAMMTNGAVMTDGSVRVPACGKGPGEPGERPGCFPDHATRWTLPLAAALTRAIPLQVEVACPY